MKLKHLFLVVGILATTSCSQPNTIYPYHPYLVPGGAWIIDPTTKESKPFYIESRTVKVMRNCGVIK